MFDGAGGGGAELGGGGGALEVRRRSRRRRRAIRRMHSRVAFSGYAGRFALHKSPLSINGASVGSKDKASQIQVQQGNFQGTSHGREQMSTCAGRSEVEVMACMSYLIPIEPI